MWRVGKYIIVWPCTIFYIRNNYTVMSRMFRRMMPFTLMILSDSIEHCNHDVNIITKTLPLMFVLCVLTRCIRRNLATHWRGLRRDRVHLSRIPEVHGRSRACAVVCFQPIQMDDGSLWLQRNVVCSYYYDYYDYDYYYCYYYYN